jgi:hypothetical protein
MMGRHFWYGTLILYTRYRHSLLRIVEFETYAQTGVLYCKLGCVNKVYFGERLWPQLYGWFGEAHDG